jgi:RNA polymerase sigma-70 factor, ECF subfamily
MLTTAITALSLLAVLTVTAGPELVARIASGQAEALRTVYDAQAGRVFALALRIVRSREEAEDIVQDTFLELWRRAREFDPKRGELTAFITAIARSRCLDRVRRARVRTRFATERPAEREGTVGQGPAAPDDQAVSDQHGRKLRDVLLSLPSEQREALELAYFEGLTQQQIAARTGSPLGTVKTRLRLALEKLSPQLEGLR